MIHNKIHLISPGCPRPGIALQVQNRSLQHHSFAVSRYCAMPLTPYFLSTCLLLFLFWFQHWSYVKPWENNPKSSAGGSQSPRGSFGYCCTPCNRTFTNPNRYREHLSKHTGVDYFKCDKCSTTFRTHFKLQCHKCPNAG